jgi:multidrug resistance efflux pump
VLRPGSVLQEGARVVSIVPAGQLRIVAFFAPEAAYGRVRRGAGARLRLKGYPWTEFGVVEARVSEVAGEDRDGRTRVELEVLPSPTLKVTLRHGMPGELEVEVERTTPLSLVMRTAGQWLKGAAGGRTP